MNDDPNDSFDDALGSLSIPSEPKIPKLSTSNLSASKVNVPSTSGAPTTSEDNKTKPASLPKLTAPNPHCILVHPKQRGNPILKSILNVPLEFRDIVPDYIVGRTTCIMYLSLRYHSLNPDYICQRLKALGSQFELRVLLVQVDKPEPFKALKNLTRVSLLAGLTLMLAWNAEEAGKIIETYKFLEKRPPDAIMEKPDANIYHNIVAALTSIKPVNKTDATTLLQNFGSLENIINSSEERLSLCAGLGPIKAQKLHKILNEPFLKRSK